MKMTKIKSTIISITLLLSLISYQATAQLSTREVPIDFRHNFSTELLPTIIMPSVDVENLLAEDEINEQLGMPFRFGNIHNVNINLTEAGVWHTLENGDKLCQLAIECSDALSINLLFDKFYLPEGAKLFIYSKDKRHHIGAFTSINNKGSKEKPRGFATELIYKDTTILEYYVPKDCTEEGIISLSGVVHGYRYLDLLKYYYGGTHGSKFDSSGRCMININCPEGDN